MTRTIIARWRAEEDDGLEHLVLEEGPEGLVAEAAVLGRSDGEAFAACYRIACDRLWRVRQLEVRIIASPRRLQLVADGEGRWSDGSGASLEVLNGAIDVDLSASPFTNTLPIRRLQLEAGQSAEIVTAYVRFPELAVSADGQRYTCLEPMRRYRYESLDSDFVREIEVDADGLVVRYPGLFTRVN